MFFQAVAAFCAHSVSISIGICQGYSAILIPQLQTSNKMHVTTDETSWLGRLKSQTSFKESLAVILRRGE